MTPFDHLLEENEASINFFSEDVAHPITDESSISDWIRSTLQEEQAELGELNFIFCSDKFLHQINVKYLGHDSYTDVITFPYSEKLVAGDIYISTDRIRENANNYAVPFEVELYRVMIHGVLHLIGYQDKIPVDKKQMTLKENQYLSLLNGQ